MPKNYSLMEITICIAIILAIPDKKIVMIYDSTTATKCREVFEADAINSLELTRESYAKRSVINKMSEQVFRLFTPLL